MCFAHCVYAVYFRFSQFSNNFHVVFILFPIFLSRNSPIHLRFFLWNTESVSCFKTLFFLFSCGIASNANLMQIFDMKLGIIVEKENFCFTLFKSLVSWFQWRIIYLIYFRLFKCNEFPSLLPVSTMPWKLLDEITCVSN